MIRLIILAICLPIFALGQVNQTDSKGRKTGKWTAKHKNGVTKYVGTYENGYPKGDFIYYSDNGKVNTVYRFSNKGQYARTWIYHDNGKIKAYGIRRNKLQDSTWVYFNPEEKMIGEDQFLKGKLHGESKLYYPATDIAPKKIAKLYMYKDSLLHGEYKEYHTTGKIAATGKYVDGQKVGVHKHYYPNGKSKRVEKWRFGVKHGIWLAYDEKGKQKTLLFYQGKQYKGKNKEKIQARLKSGELKW